MPNIVIKDETGTIFPLLTDGEGATYIDNSDGTWVGKMTVYIASNSPFTQLIIDSVTCENIVDNVCVEGCYPEGCVPATTNMGDGAVTYLSGSSCGESFVRFRLNASFPLIIDEREYPNLAVEYATQDCEIGDVVSWTSDDGLTIYDTQTVTDAGFCYSFIGGPIPGEDVPPAGSIMRVSSTPARCIRVKQLNASSINGCFDGATLVSTTTGLTPISLIQLGDEVISFSEAGELGVSTVTLIDVYEREVFEYAFSNGWSFRATDNHRVLTKRGRFIEMRYLRQDDILFTLAGEEISIVSVTVQPSTTVYNLKGLEGNSSYIANGIRVSNISYVLD
jgi:hypothetical protein